ncbi:transcriptional regulator BetI [Roseibium album]|nr:transcriptional regulator BetI [Roseibium album]
MVQKNPSAAGRPQEHRVTTALMEATLIELAENGFEGSTVAAIANRARTSKQAVYRRFGNKTDMIAAAVEHGLLSIRSTSPQRISVAEDLRQSLAGIVSSFQETPLGGAIRALVPHRDLQPITEALENAENDRRLVLRQIFIATPFETDMETRIDLLLGLIYFRLLIRNVPIGQNDIERAIYLVLGLVAPRDPAPHAGMPGI